MTLACSEKQSSQIISGVTVIFSHAGNLQRTLHPAQRGALREVVREGSNRIGPGGQNRRVLRGHP